MTTDPTKVTPEEITQYREQLADNSKALADLEVIERTEGDLERAARVLARRAGEEEVKSGSNWQLALQQARKVVCNDKFKDGLVPEFIGGFIGALTASADRILVAVATPVAIYIIRVGLENFCKTPDSAS
ncbi:hypothetical protein SD81_019535 [Tolypothrix campylonemoides VB511288]|nr:hypothetical protein SD81_019535 [Tolypothrix campylonemoides VB511288]